MRSGSPQLLAMEELKASFSFCAKLFVAHFFDHQTLNCRGCISPCDQ
jgi:hypothetical protein